MLVHARNNSQVIFSDKASSIFNFNFGNQTLDDNRDA